MDNGPHSGVIDTATDGRIAELEFQNTRLRFQIEQLQNIERAHVTTVQRLQALYQQVPIAYVTLDQKGVIKDWNPAAVQLLERIKNGLANVPLLFFVARRDAYVFLDHLLRCKRSREKQVVSELRLNSRGKLLPVQIVSVPVRSDGDRFFQTALVDQTEREKNERAQREAQEFSDTIIRTIHEPLVVLGPELRVLRMNDAFSKLFGIRSELAIGASLESILNLWWSGNELRARLEGCLLKNVSLANFEFEVEPRNLGRRVFVFNARPLYQKEGSPALLVALEDITARKDAEERVVQSNQQLQQLNNELEKRVDARTKELSDSNKQLESFCYSIAHDLRGPLRTIAGFGTILQDRFADKLGPVGADHVRRMVAGAGHMDALVRDLLEYGRFNTVQLPATRIDADEILTHAIGDLQPAISDTHASIERKGPLPHVLGHGVALETALSNLLSNALKFVPPDTAPKVTIWPEEQGKDVSICIADNGIGIPPEHQGRIFGVFQRLHSQKEYPGTGIGLAIVSRAIHRMGGHVSVQSAPGKGSMFCINLPKAAG